MAAKKLAMFLMKSEPSTYPWSKLVAEGRASWDGVRNYEARNNLRAMKEGDLCLFYHSNDGKEIVGVARVVKTAYADPTADGADWSAVDIAPAFPLVAAVSLDVLRTAKGLEEVHVVKKPRISVVSITPAEFKVILKLAKTVMPKV